jgi:hypothetical protein
MMDDIYYRIAWRSRSSGRVNHEKRLYLIRGEAERVAEGANMRWKFAEIDHWVEEYIPPRHAPEPECRCVLPEQSCPACRETARKVYANDPA